MPGLLNSLFKNTKTKKRRGKKIMKRYGLKIGDVGIEFPSREEREKALKAFTLGCDVKICVSGVKYRDGSGTFSVYERLSEEILVTCNGCKGVFGADVCPMRGYPHKIL